MKFCNFSIKFDQKQRLLKKVQTNKSQSKEVGLPELVMKYQIFHGDQSAMEAAMAAGQIWEEEGPC